MVEGDITNEFLADFCVNSFPAELLDRYEPLECFSQSEIGETLLVESKRDGKQYICKVYSKEYYSVIRTEDKILENLQHKGLPHFVESFTIDNRLYVVWEYIEGTSLKALMAREKLTESQIRAVGIQLCDILTYLHSSKPPVIHRDIKPSNVVLQGDKVYLIDFGIARVYDDKAGTDTICLGTQDYAPPEQYGFAQTDCRTDIYSLGILLRVLLTGNTKSDGKIANKQLAHVVERCTALDPGRRYTNAAEVKKALILSEPKKYRRRMVLIVFPIAAVLIVSIALGLHIYNENNTPVDWNNHTPAFLSSENVIADSVSYLNERFDTDFFAASEEVADIGYVKSILTEVYGFDADYINALPNEPDNTPRENENNFLPWGLGDDEKIPREILIYMVVKAYWPEVVADWSSLTDDTGMYPGVRVAQTFVEEHGIFDEMNKYGDITQGEVAIVFCAADHVFSETK